MMLGKNISTYISRSIACSLPKTSAFALPRLAVFSLLMLFSLCTFAQRQGNGQQNKQTSQQRSGQTQKQHLSKSEQLKLRQKEIDDSIPWWRGFQVKVDLVGPVERAVSSYGQYEAGVRFNLKDKYFPVIELGYGTADEDNDVTNIHYKTSAPYGRIGCDFNILKNKHDIYRLYVGARYAYTSFKYDIDHAPLTDPVWGGEVPFSGKDIKASYHWLEALAGVDAKIAGPVHLGWTIRYRRRLAHSDGDMGNVWYVPGFGKQGGSRISGTFEVMVEF